MSLVGAKGVDISYANGDIDLNKVKEAGYSFVMIRCGYGSDISSQDDAQFENNVRKAEALGIPWGVYLYSYATNVSEAQSEVEHVKRLLKGKKPTMPIALDVEDTAWYQKHGCYNRLALSAIVGAFIQGIKAAGYYPMLYTGYYEIRDYLTADVVNSCDIWLAEWCRYPDYAKDNLGMWQYGGETNLIESNSISGVGVIDKDKCYKDYPTIIKNGGYNGWGKGAASNISGGKSAQSVIDTAYALLDTDKHPDSCDIMHWYGGFSDEINDVPCCCAGMMYLFREAGALDLIPGGKVADCGSLCRNFYNAGQLYGPDDVQPGDLVIFSWSKERSSYRPASELGYKTLDHVEYCVAVNDSTITCIGANNGGSECDDYQIKTRYKSNISCCCRPEYSDCTVTYDTEKSESSEEIEAYIKSVQSWLNNNYSTGLDVDGIYGPKTKAALVKALQTELNRQFGAGLAVDGIYGNMTASAVVNLYVGAQGNITKTLQGFLICNGYDTNGFDGIFGTGTMKAVKSCQSAHGASADGIVGPVTWRLLAA